MSGNNTAKVTRLVDRAQLWAERAIGETARMYSYVPGSNRYYGALNKAREAEQKMLAAFDAARAALSRARGEA